jgi:hypothetical protein
LPRITVGLPVYKGADLVPKTLECLQRQTFNDFEVIISVDGGDTETAAACRPFLSDPRFRMVVHPNRLDWFGNFNWLLQQPLQEFFCFRQHDDTTAENFFDVLLQTADRSRNAAAIYCDCQYAGGRSHVEIASSITGDPLDRLLQYLDWQSAVPVRGLIRTTALPQAGLVRANEFRAKFEIFIWLAKLLRWGDFRRVGEPLYYRLDHAHNYSKQVANWPDDRNRFERTTLFTGWLEAAMPLCRTAEERLSVQKLILDRVGQFRPGTSSPEEFIRDCFDRLRYEGNTHLLGSEESSKTLEELKNRQHELKLIDQSSFARLVYRVRRGFLMSTVIYPESRLRRVSYQFRYLRKVVSVAWRSRIAAAEDAAKRLLRRSRMSAAVKEPSL